MGVLVDATITAGATELYNAGNAQGTANGDLEVASGLTIGRVQAQLTKLVLNRTTGSTVLFSDWAAGATGKSAYLLRAGELTEFTIASAGTGRSFVDWSSSIFSGGHARGEMVRLWIANSGLTLAQLSPVVPAAPAAPTVGGAADSTLTVTWTAPANGGGSPVTSYDLQYRRLGESTWTEVLGATSPYELSNLRPGTAYEVQVRAVNRVDPGAWSASGLGTTTGPSVRADIVATHASRLRTLADGTVADGADLEVMPGLDIVVIAATPGLFYLTGSSQWSTWVNGAGSGQSVYLIAWRTSVESSRDTVEEFRVSDATSNSTTLSWAETVSITVGATYSVVIADSGQNLAQLRNGDPGAAAPAAPSAPTTGAATDSTLTVTWTTPADDGGVGVSSYDLQYRRQGEPDWTEVLGATSPHELTRLRRGTTFEAQVRAVNAVGAGAWSATGRGTTTAATPQAPTLTVGSPSTTTTLTATWTTPDDEGGSPITSYDLRHRVEGEADWTTELGVSSPHLLGGLSPNTTYEAQVRAVNSISPSPWSTIDEAATRGVVTTLDVTIRNGGPATVPAGTLAPAVVYAGSLSQFGYLPSDAKGGEGQLLQDFTAEEATWWLPLKRDLAPGASQVLTVPLSGGPAVEPAIVLRGEDELVITSTSYRTTGAVSYSMQLDWTGAAGARDVWVAAGLATLRVDGDNIELNYGGTTFDFDVPGRSARVDVIHDGSRTLTFRADPPTGPTRFRNATVSAGRGEGVYTVKGVTLRRGAGQGATLLRIGTSGDTGYVALSGPPTGFSQTQAGDADNSWTWRGQAGATEAEYVFTRPEAEHLSVTDRALSISTGDAPSYRRPDTPDIVEAPTLPGGKVPGIRSVFIDPLRQVGDDSGMGLESWSLLVALFFASAAAGTAHRWLSSPVVDAVVLILVLVIPTLMSLIGIPLLTLSALSIAVTTAVMMQR